MFASEALHSKIYYDHAQYNLSVLLSKLGEMFGYVQVSLERKAYDNNVLIRHDLISPTYSELVSVKADPFSSLIFSNTSHSDKISLTLDHAPVYNAFTKFWF